MRMRASSLSSSVEWKAIINQSLRQTSLLKSFSNHTVKHLPGVLPSFSVSATNPSLLVCCSAEVEDGVQQTPPMAGSSKPV